MLKKSEDPMWKYPILALSTFQFCLIARIDDIFQFRLNKLPIHDLFLFVLCEQTDEEVKEQS